MDDVGKGNLSVLIDMYQMMRDCTPPEALMLYNWLSDFMNGQDVQNMTNQQWAGKYTDIIAQCITNKRLWIGINIKTGAVELLASAKSDLLMFRSETQQRMLSIEQVGKKDDVPVPDVHFPNHFPVSCRVCW